jgi:hypothetical protein
MQGQHIIAFDGTTMAFALDENRIPGPPEGAGSGDDIELVLPG